MKRTQLFTLLLFFAFSFISHAQNKVEFNILFGRYVNDHTNKKFYSSERIWQLSNNQLTHSSSYDNKISIDSFQVKQPDLDSIHIYFTENKLKKSNEKDLSESYLNKRGIQLRIKGYININKQNYSFDIKANSNHIIETDVDADILYRFEKVLYKIVKLRNGK